MYILNDEFENTADTLATPDTLEFGDIAQARAAMFALLAAFINQRPDSEFVNKLRTAGIHQFLTILIEEDGQSQIQDGLQELGAYLEETLKKDANSLVEELAVDWTRLFRGLRPGYGPKPPYAYLHKKTKLSELDFLQKISGIYTSYGASIEPTQSNRPDYLGLQLAFLSFLYQQASDAYQEGNKEKAIQIELAATDFFENEFADWSLTFCQEAESHAKTAFYHGYLAILQGQIRDLAES
jgi:TorA maturation chaperone TorD